VQLALTMLRQDTMQLCNSHDIHRQSCHSWLWLLQAGRQAGNNHPGPGDTSTCALRVRSRL
jgi:hypothetical protein